MEGKVRTHYSVWSPITSGRIWNFYYRGWDFYYEVALISLIIKKQQKADNQKTTTS